MQDVKEDTSMMTDDDDDDEMEDLDALAKGMDQGRTGPSSKAASAAETATNIGVHYFSTCNLLCLTDPPYSHRFA